MSVFFRIAIAALAVLTPVRVACADAEAEGDKSNAGASHGDGASVAAAAPLNWRKDPLVPRRPGSYLGGGMGYAMGYAWYSYAQRDFYREYSLGPMHASATYVRVGDAFFEWLAVGFQVDIVSGAYGGSPEKTAAFGMYLDTTFYPVAGLGLRPSAGFGFGYSQAGQEEHKLGFGGPLNLAFSISYEIRITRLITLGPLCRISWIRGESYDSMYITVGIEVLKWFMTAEG